MPRCNHGVASLFIAALALAISVSSHAATGTGIGFGAKASSLGGMTAALPRDGYSSFQNPATMSAPSTFAPRTGEGRKLGRVVPGVNASGAASSTASISAPPVALLPSNVEVSWGVVFLVPQLKEIPGPVVVQNATTGDSVRNGSVDTDYPNVIGQALGLNFRNARVDWKPSLGATFYLPLDRFAYIDSGEPFAPDYVHFRSRFQRPEFHIAFSAQPQSVWRVGGGIQLGAGINSNVDVFLQSDAAKSSSMRVSASLKTKAAPYFGTQLDLSPDLTSGLNLRLPLSNPQDIRVRASGRVIGDLSALDFSFRSLSTAYYEPMTVEWGNLYRLSNETLLHLQVDYQAWSRFESPNIEIDTTSTTNCTPNCGGLQFANSNYPSFTTRDIFIPRIGLEVGSLRMGYAYEPSIFADTPGNLGHNLLDPARHRLSAGYGFKGVDFLSTLLPWSIDLSVVYSVLESYSVSKSGDAIGAPGYEVGGNLFGAGVSLNLAL